MKIFNLTSFRREKST